MRAVISISYNGTTFLGSQSQVSTPNTVIGNLEKIVLKLGINSKVVASGRTDKGVHAIGQICHIDLPLFWSDLKKLTKVLNKMLPPTIKINYIKETDTTFHARYSAKKRVYRYIIKEGKSNPFEDNFVTFLDKIDFNSIERKIKIFVGKHNFCGFMKQGSDVDSTTRVIYRAFAYRYQGYIVLNFEANGFLRSQIRLMVGGLLKLNDRELTEQLNSKKEYKIKPAPPNGLYLAKIKYV